MTLFATNNTLARFMFTRYDDPRRASQYPFTMDSVRVEFQI